MNAEYIVIVRRDEMTVFEGRIGADDYLQMTGGTNSPRRVRLTATDLSAFAEDQENA